MFSNNGDVIVHDSKYHDNGKKFIRQLVYDLVFFFEMVILFIIGYNLVIEPEYQQIAKNRVIIASSICHVAGLILKVFYYTKLHVWSDIINVMEKDENDNWIFETEFFFMGNERKIRKQLL